MIGRALPPYGYAPPAGHVDGRVSFEEAARSELFEEVGLKCGSLELLLEDVVANRCKRVGGDWHRWQVFSADEVTGVVRPSPREVKTLKWQSRGELNRLNGQLLANETKDRLEPVWAILLSKLGIVSLSEPQLRTVYRLI
jgi:8-oxo-dGTP pyrophosphatase MutT (NUDIX family)